MLSVSKAWDFHSEQYFTSPGLHAHVAWRLQTIQAKLWEQEIYDVEPMLYGSLARMLFFNNPEFGNYYSHTIADCDFRCYVDYQRRTKVENALEESLSDRPGLEYNYGSAASPSKYWAQFQSRGPGIKIQAAITDLIYKVPLHNLDILATPTGNMFYPGLKLHVPNFSGANDAFSKNQFLLNPTVFEVIDGKAVIHVHEIFDAQITKVDFAEATLAYLLKTFLVYIISGKSLAPETHKFFNALDNTQSNLYFGKYRCTLLESVISFFYDKYFNSPDTHQELKHIFSMSLNKLTFVHKGILTPGNVILKEILLLRESPPSYDLTSLTTTPSMVDDVKKSIDAPLVLMQPPTFAADSLKAELIEDATTVQIASIPPYKSAEHTQTIFSASSASDSVVHIQSIPTQSTVASRSHKEERKKRKTAKLNSVEPAAIAQRELEQESPKITRNAPVPSVEIIARIVPKVKNTAVVTDDSKISAAPSEPTQPKEPIIPAIRTVAKKISAAETPTILKSKVVTVEWFIKILKEFHERLNAINNDLDEMRKQYDGLPPTLRNQNNKDWMVLQHIQKDLASNLSTMHNWHDTSSSDYDTKLAHAKEKKSKFNTKLNDFKNLVSLMQSFLDSLRPEVERLKQTQEKLFQFINVLSEFENNVKGIVKNKKEIMVGNFQLKTLAQNIYSNLEMSVEEKEKKLVDLKKEYSKLEKLFLSSKENIRRNSFPSVSYRLFLIGLGFYLFKFFMEKASSFDVKNFSEKDFEPYMFPILGILSINAALATFMLPNGRKKLPARFLSVSSGIAAIYCGTNDLITLSKEFRPPPNTHPIFNVQTGKVLSYCMLFSINVVTTLYLALGDEAADKILKVVDALIPDGPKLPLAPKPPGNQHRKTR